MGSVRTEQIKRTAVELMRRFPKRFSSSFEENKAAVNALVRGATPKVRNQIAGYITHALAGMKTPANTSEHEKSE